MRVAARRVVCAAPDTYSAPYLAGDDAPASSAAGRAVEQVAMLARDRIREAGAMLLGVPAGQATLAEGRVGEPSGRTLSFAEVGVAALQAGQPLTVTATPASTQVPNSLAAALADVEVDLETGAVGFEFFGNLESAEGRNAREITLGAEKRKWTQMSGDVIYRFAWDDLYVAARYNTAKGKFAGNTSDGTVNRTQAGGGWFMTPGILLKLEYVRQEYNDYPVANRYHDARFDGIMIEGVVAF